MKFDSRTPFQSHAAAAVVTKKTSLRDRLVRTRRPNNVERGGRTALTSFVITKVECFMGEEEEEEEEEVRGQQTVQKLQPFVRGTIS